MDTSFNDSFLYDFSQINAVEYDSLPQLDFDQDTLQCLLNNPEDFTAPITNTQPPTFTGLGTPESSTQTPSPTDPQLGEIKKMLQDLSTRLEDLERAVSAGNCQINQIGFNVDTALPKILSATENFRETIDNLRKSLRVFTRELVSHLLGWHVEGDVEPEPST